jgi:hypothetical protein
MGGFPEYAAGRLESIENAIPEIEKSIEAWEDYIDLL